MRISFSLFKENDKDDQRASISKTPASTPNMVLVDIDRYAIPPCTSALFLSRTSAISDRIKLIGDCDQPKGMITATPGAFATPGAA